MLKNPYPMVRLEPARALGGAREVGGPQVSLSGLLGGRPGVFQGVRLSRKLPYWRVLQPEVVDEVVQVVTHSHLVWSWVQRALVVLSESLQ